MTGSKLTMDAVRYPQRFLAVKRETRGLLETWCGISLRGGKFQRHPVEWGILQSVIDLSSIPGIQAFL